MRVTWQVASRSPCGAYFHSSDLTLESAQTGRVDVTVSRERIGRLWASEAREKRPGLDLALPRTEAELAEASHPAHRDMLEQRLQAIRDAISQLA